MNRRQARVAWAVVILLSVVAEAIGFIMVSDYRDNDIP